MQKRVQDPTVVHNPEAFAALVPDLKRFLKDADPVGAALAWAERAGY